VSGGYGRFTEENLKDEEHLDDGDVNERKC
jgi:hypothetical protein